VHEVLAGLCHHHVVVPVLCVCQDEIDYIREL